MRRFLDISGLRRHYPNPVGVGEAIRASVRAELGLPVSVGIAANKMLAKMASEAAKPDGLRHVPKDDGIGFLHPNRCGLCLVSAKPPTPPSRGSGLRPWATWPLSAWSCWYADLGPRPASTWPPSPQGRDDRPFSPDRKNKSMSVSETYERDLTSTDEVDTELLRLCDRLGARVATTGMQGNTVALTVRYANFETIVRQEVQKHPVSTSHDVFQAVKRLRSRFDWTPAIRLLGVGISGLGEDQRPEQMLTDRDPRWDDLSGAVAVVRSRYGENSVAPARVAPTSPKRVRKPQSPDSD